jgi:hypothetical protein
MGISLEQVLTGSNESVVGVTVVSNEDDGIVSYGHGRLQLFKADLTVPAIATLSRRSARDRLQTMGGEDLLLHFSDRTVAGSNNPAQPFDVKQRERLAFTITPPWASGFPATIDMRFVSWSGQNFRLTATQMSDLLVGIGPALSGKSPNSVFTFSFYYLPIL